MIRQTATIDKDKKSYSGSGDFTISIQPAR